MRSAAWIVLRHKLTRPDEVYSVAEFGLPGDRRLDLAPYPTFTGINVWTEHVARRLARPALRRLPLAGLAALLVLLLGVGLTTAARRRGRNL